MRKCSAQPYLAQEARQSCGPHLIYATPIAKREGDGHLPEYEIRKKGNNVLLQRTINAPPAETM